jgi:hypothetical protein
MEKLYAIVHKSGVVLSIAAHVETTADGLLVTAMPNSQSASPLPEKHLIPDVDLVDVVKFEYNPETETVENYYKGTSKKPLGLALDADARWRLANNGMTFKDGVVGLV